MNKYSEDRLQQIISELPYYWDTNNPDSNIYRLFKVVASLMGQWEESINRIKDMRPIETAEGVHLDHVAGDVGVTRDDISFISNKVHPDVMLENDEMLRRRIKWNIKVQESSGTVEDIKELVAEGLQMYRVRTGLGGKVAEYKVRAVDFTTTIAPEYNTFPPEDREDLRDIKASDIHIFNNREPRLGMEAPDSFHGRYGNLEHFYQINIPWKAMPWSDSEQSLIWRSQDTFDRPLYYQFTEDDTDGSTIEISHDLERDFVATVLIDDQNVYRDPVSVSVGNNTTTLDLDDYNVNDDWRSRVTGAGYSVSFDSSSLNGGKVEITHNLDELYPVVSIYDNNNVLVSPDNVTYISNNTVEIDLSSYTINEQWVATVYGGEDMIGYIEDFTQEDLIGKSITITHALGANAPHVVLYDNNDMQKNIKEIKETGEERVKITLSDSDFDGTWHIKCLAHKAEIPEDRQHGWGESVYTGQQEDLYIDPIKELIDMTKPSATRASVNGYGGMIWKSQDDLHNPRLPRKDKYHGWGARFDGDVEETLYAMENLDGFWVNY